MSPEQLGRPDSTRDDYAPPPPGASESRLLIFLLDGSSSMAETETPDGRTKAAHLEQLVQGSLQRFRESAVASAFQVSLVYFGAKPIVDNGPNTGRYVAILDPSHPQAPPPPVRNPVSVMGSAAGSTAIGKALREARAVFVEFLADQELPVDKSATVLLFSDGGENEESTEKVLEAMQALRVGRPCTLASISLGLKADEKLLQELASNPNAQQKNAFMNSAVLADLPNPDKLFLVGHVDGELTAVKASQIREFVDLTSQVDRS